MLPRIVPLAAVCGAVALSCQPASAADPQGPRAPPAAAAEEPCKLSLITQAPLRRIGRSLFTDMKINGRGANMMVDTGSFISILSSDSARRFDAKLGSAASYSGVGAGGTRLGKSETASYGVVAGVGGLQVTNIVAPEQVAFGQLSDPSFTLLSAVWNRPNIDPPPDGLIGANLLDRADIDYDVLGGKITLYRSKGTCRSPSVAMDGEMFQADLLTDRENEHRPVVSAVIGKHRLRALLDTGAEASLLSRTAASDVGLDFDALAAKGRAFEIRGIGQNAAHAVRAVVPAIRFDEVDVSNLPIDVADIDLGDGVDMLLGDDFLRKTHFWVSNSHHKVIFQIPPRPSPVFAARP